MIPSNTVDSTSYALVFAEEKAGNVKSDPKKVFTFFEDFSDSKLNKWTRVWGEWTVQNGAVFGKTGKSTFGNAEVGLFLKEGRDWDDIELELDLMETGSGVVFPGPFLRVQEFNLQYTTAWWFEYYTDHKGCTMRPFIINRDGSWKYKCQLPQALVKNKWFHFRYQVVGDRISQWANDVLIQTFNVDKEWMIPSGSIALGCHGEYSGSPHGCRTFYDNIKVKLLVNPIPTVSIDDRCQLNCQTGAPIGTKEHPANSCKQIHDSKLSDQNKSSAKNGVYWIKTSLKWSDSIQSFCDMKNGGWTLVGKIYGPVGNVYSKWLVKNVNTQDLKVPKIDSGHTGYSCFDARLLAVKHASQVMLSCGDNPGGIGSKWVQWELPSGREYSTWWNHGIGQAKVQAAGTSQVTVKTWNGNSKVRKKENKYFRSRTIGLNTSHYRIFPTKTGEYPRLVYTKTVDSVEGVLWLASQTPNKLCYLPPSNSRKNGVPFCIPDKWGNHPNYFFVAYIISVYKSILNQLFTEVEVASGEPKRNR